MELGPRSSRAGRWLIPAAFGLSWAVAAFLIIILAVWGDDIRRRLEPTPAPTPTPTVTTTPEECESLVDRVLRCWIGKAG